MGPSFDVNRFKVKVGIAHVNLVRHLKQYQFHQGRIMSFYM